MELVYTSMEEPEIKEVNIGEITNEELWVDTIKQGKDWNHFLLNP